MGIPTMTTIHCPTCNAALPQKELADGWCETCGKKIPPFLLSGSGSGSFTHVTSKGEVVKTAEPYYATQTGHADTKLAKPQVWKLMGLMVVCGLVGALVGGAAGGFKSGSNSTHIGMMAGLGLGLGLAQAFGWMGKKK